ncbi:electron transfer flavoprotein subunit alpha/FixB family protein [Haladaptatus sp. F3-133]|jgi:electron transfer flavoprotein alpha subunit|uniref:Electron transfer flavoprotein subunit alpha/FixB family protein n=1 Tax=Halorutilus salinus TaxID=2487751 RepID=A0A9Q4C489_9EURY|nr:electron transfer flavoprotein subunit alpha/FixB family protein [Halorutilus salinus]MCX2818710.1 electron transfer flavoprotein subunit alpha/FixB family protein [Halorutilus salinus]
MSDVLAISEHRQGELRDASYEVVTAGRELADETGGDLHLGVIGGDVDTYADELNLEGVDAIHTVDEGDEFNHDVYTQTTEQLFDATGASYLLVPHTVNGMDYAPAVAGKTDVPVVTDAIGIAHNGALEITREMYSSKVETTVDVDSDEAIVTTRPAEWEATETDGDASVEAFDVEIDQDAVGSTVTGFEEAAGGDVDLGESEFIVSIGRGIDEEDNLDLIEELADTVGADLGSSRPLVDNGWLPKNRQVGQSGKVVTPDVYIAIGISGAVQHVAGMKGADTIIAINTDPSAPIYDIADYGVVGDLFEVVPQLIEEFGGTPP